MNSTEERALCIVEQRLKGIRKDDGYCTDAGLNVYREREHLDESQCPAAVIWSGDETTNESPAFGGVIEISLSVSIEVHAVFSKPETGPMLSGLKRDVKRALFGDDSYGGLVFNDGSKLPVASIGYTGCKVFPRKDGSKTASVTLSFAVIYKEPLGA